MGTREGTTTRAGNIKSAGGGGADLSKRVHFETLGKLSPKELEAITRYQEGANYGINRVHRGRNPAGLTPELQSVSDRLDAAIAKSRINKPTLLRRGFALPGGAAELKPGMIFVEGGFASTSAKTRIHREFTGGPTEQRYVIRARVPAGSRGLSVPHAHGGAGFYAYEHEVILPRGSQFKIRRARKVKSGEFKGAIVLDADLING
jgi:hypothetical protein